MTGSLKAAPSPLERYVQYSLIQGPLLAGCPEEHARFGKWAGARLGHSFSVRLGGKEVDGDFFAGNQACGLARHQQLPPRAHSACFRGLMSVSTEL